MVNFGIISHKEDSISLAHEFVRDGNTVDIWGKVDGIGKQDVGVGFKGINIYSQNDMPIEQFIDKHEVIYFGHSDYGELQTELRKKRDGIIGTSILGEKIEKDRMLGIEMCEQLGILIPPTFKHNSINEVKDYIKKYPKPYILKQTGDMSKTFNCKALRKDSLDIIWHLITLENYTNIDLNGKMVLQEVVEGVEVAITGVFAGSDWIRQDGQIATFINFENKRLLDGNRGLPTGELGTGGYWLLGETEFFNKVLAPLTETLKQYNHVGYVDANCIINEKGIFVLEYTMRGGYPTIDIIHSMLNEPVSSFYIKLGKGKVDGYNLNTINRGVVLMLAFPTFPFESAPESDDDFKYEVLDLSALDDDELDEVHLQDVSMVNNFGEYGKQLIIASSQGFVATITGRGVNFLDANKNALKILQKIVPAQEGIYRTDIGMQVTQRFINTHFQKVIGVQNENNNVSYPVSDRMAS